MFVVLDPHQASQPISVRQFFNPQQMFFLCDKLITQGEKRETSTQNLQQNNVALQVKQAFVSPISSPP